MTLHGAPCGLARSDPLLIKPLHPAACGGHGVTAACSGRGPVRGEHRGQMSHALHQVDYKKKKGMVGECLDLRTDQV